MYRPIAAVLLLVALTSGCVSSAASRMGTYPMQGQDLAQQGVDMEACREAADQLAGSAGVETASGAAVGLATGAVIGAALGAIAGAFFGLAGEGAAIGAALGGATGGLQGTATGFATNRDVRAADISACMGARGYSVAR